MISKSGDLKKEREREKGRTKKYIKQDMQRERMIKREKEITKERKFFRSKQKLALII